MEAGLEHKTVDFLFIMIYTKTMTTMIRDIDDNDWEAFREGCRLEGISANMKMRELITEQVKKYNVGREKVLQQQLDELRQTKMKFEKGKK